MKAEHESRCQPFPPLCSSPPQRSPLQALATLSTRALPSALLSFASLALREPAAFPKSTGKKTQLMWKIKGAYLAAFPHFFCSSCMTQAPSTTPLRQVLILAGQAVEMSHLHTHPPLCPGDSRSLMWKYRKEVPLLLLLTFPTQKKFSEFPVATHPCAPRAPPRPR